MSDTTPPTPASGPLPDGPIPATPTMAPAPHQRPRVHWITPTLAIVAALAIGLFGGIVIGHNTSAAAQGRSGNFSARGGGQIGGIGGFGGGAGGFASGNLASGTIVSVSDGTIVLKTRAGNQTVTTTEKTNVTKTSTSSVSALKAGQTSTVVGTKDASGNLTASSVSEGVGGLRGGFGRTGGNDGSNAPTP
jgi:hypothetical protein